jgi:hypothetical protein
MTDQPAPQPTPSNAPPVLGEVRELFGIKLQWNGSQWQKVTAHGR